MNSSSLQKAGIHMSVTDFGCNKRNNTFLHAPRHSFMILQKTAKAIEELQPGSRQLPQRARAGESLSALGGVRQRPAKPCSRSANRRRAMA